MNNIIEKWNSEPRFKAKVKLGLYTLFVVMVSIFALSTRNMNTITNTSELNDETTKQEENITIPNEYTYTINIMINDKKYQYSGTKTSNQEKIIKTVDNVISNYIYQENNYYKLQNEQYVLTNQEEVYDVVDYNYLKIETINQYLYKSQKENEIHKVYLKDIILGNDSDKYITISISENKINVDYTSLIQLFDKTIEKHLIEIVIEEKE